MRIPPAPFVLVLLASGPALAVKVADITRIGGQRTNILTGVGLVFGLKGTGDGGDFTAGHEAAGGHARQVRRPGDR